MADQASSNSRNTFPRRMRLTGSRQFEAVYQAKVRVSIGALMMYGLPNDLGMPRLGLAVPRRVGTAPRRNLIKRRLREAFRLMQYDWPRGYDLIVNVRPHEPMILADYQKALSKAMRSMHGTWSKRIDKQSQADPPT
jgi:ribonuclease P protein component